MTITRPSLPLQSLNALGLGYIVTDIDHQVLLINYAAKSLLTLTHDIDSLEEIVEHLPARLVLLDHVKYCSIEHKSCSFREVELNERIVRVFLSPLFEGDELKGNLLTLEDITERVQSDHARDQFLAFLVHELRTPLTAIHGNASLIEDHFTIAMQDKDFREMIQDIGSGSQNLLGLVNQFLDMSRLEEGRITYDWQSFDLAALINETTRSLQIIAQEKQLTLTFVEPVLEGLQAVGDPGRVRQVLTNLIGNGLKFTDSGSVTVTLGLNKAIAMFEIMVSDTGPGIPSESRSGMFQKYFQAANNKYRHDSAKSTGLGLYVTRLIVEGMGGQIGLLDAGHGVGSTFMFSISQSTPERLKLMAKQIADAAQGVEHAQAADHQSLQIT